ncbi:MAG TPA: hypothetical protein PLO55_12000 [Thermotogota bacterium]|nr:hypothetical protein [Thermotogota bacterium]
MLTIKKKINGAWYDTEAAEQLAEYWTTELSRFDLDYLREGLFRQHGRLFIAGESGARMRYARNAEGGGKVGGEGIELVTYAEAAEWIETLPEKERPAAKLNLDQFLMI